MKNPKENKPTPSMAADQPAKAAYIRPEIVTFEKGEIEEIIGPAFACPTAFVCGVGGN